MNTDPIFALDVGGTFIKASVLENDSIIEETISQFDSHSHEDAETILNHFVSILTTLSQSYQVYKQKTKDVYTNKTVGIGFAFPGPFDYEQGISYIKGLNKFEGIYGISFREELTKRLKQSNLFQGAKKVRMRFENDARLFGLGVSTLYSNERIISLTIGTGLGSVFIERGTIIKNDKRVPEEGYLYNHIFKGKTVDDQFSRRGILQLAADQNLIHENLDVKEIAGLAKEGNEKAKEIFHEFGCNLGEMLLPFIEKFKTDRMIIGGQIAKSYELFGKSLEHQIAHTNTKVTPLDHALYYTYAGIAKMFAD
ncbi:ROK family protein [Neobacillus kokaensis]|uniref:ROK family protein n=1 Tax=Neobacillus kokaensis TaxID=2759023 RepID=UPI00174A7608|nr:ROK family protein [Neobacillus kokaensis]